MRIALPVIVLSFAAAAPASAAQMIVDARWTNYGFNTLQRFDPARGTLTGVTVTVDALSGLGWSQAASSGSTAASVAGSLLLNVGGTEWSGQATGVGSGDFWTTVAGQTTRRLGEAEFARFLGTDPLMIYALATPTFTTSFATSGDARVFRPESSRVASANIRVVYDYAVAGVTAVPEPATWAMMIGGFGVVGVAMRRRRRAGSVVTTA